MTNNTVASCKLNMTIELINIHFGTNPSIGGSPPSEHIIIIVSQNTSGFVLLMSLD